LTIYLAVKRWPRLLEIVDDNPGPHHNTSLAYAALLYAKRKKATDPKDKVFALYSLFRELSIEIPGPDYRKSETMPHREILREKRDGADLIKRGSRLTKFGDKLLDFTRESLESSILG